MNLEKLGLLSEQIKAIKRGEQLGFKKGVARSEYKHLKKIAKKTKLNLDNFFIKNLDFTFNEFSKSFLREQHAIGEKESITVHYFRKEDRWKVKKMIAEMQFFS